MNRSIGLAMLLAAMMVDLAGAEQAGFSRGRTIVTATGEMFYGAGEWWQLAIAGMQLVLYSLAEDCETYNECQDEWADDYWPADGDLPLGNFQSELGLAHFIAQNLNIGARVLIRPDDREDPLRYVWAWGPELTYYFATRYPGIRPFVGGGAYWSRGRLSAEQHRLSPDRSELTISRRTRQYRAGIDVMVTPMTSLLVQLNYQQDELGDISPFARDGLALGLGLSFSLE
ncbi:MAG TPA: hypothetical protein EYQ18_04920 [Candidatus Handelsmanbacteria bacterium]|nr:hypothetical protein [Candidatus Handelsmanbacteria bacterium]